MNSNAILGLPAKAYAVAMQPLMRLQQVIEFGMFRVIIFAIFSDTCYYGLVAGGRLIHLYAYLTISGQENINA